MKKKESAEIVSQEEISAGIMSLVLKTTIADDTKAGQFVSLFERDASHLLPRPISVCETDPKEGTLRLVYRVAGHGTESFSKMKPHHFVELIGPLGNGFPVEKMAGKRVLLMGGGIGIPPMLSCAQAFSRLNEEDQPSEVTFAVGYRTNDKYLYDDLVKEAPVVVSTDDGTFGTHGTVIDAVRANKIRADVIFACGPKPMLRGIKNFAEDREMECYISMEEHMACGVGVCLGCITKTVDVNDHSKVKNARVCKDGPVFNAQEVDLS